MLNQPAAAPPPECLPSTEIFRRLAKKMALTDPCLFDSDEDLARALLESAREPGPFTLEELQKKGWVRLVDPSRTSDQQRFRTPSGKLEFYSQLAATDGFDPLPAYVPPLEVTDQRRAGRYPLVLISAASHFFLNSMFANLPSLRLRNGEPHVVVHPADAADRALENGDLVRIFNDRGSFDAVVVVGDAVRRGVIASPKGYWPKLSRRYANVNATVDERDADMGQGAVFHDNRVEIERAAKAVAIERSEG
jgi:anaerobic selenocysteine-containing dehydrogenase